jgi:hypothetical protein
MAEPPRIAAARMRAASAKRALAALSIAGFLGVFLLVKAAHPGHSSSAPATTNEPSSESRDDDRSPSFGFGGGSIAPPQTVVPNVHSSTS